MTVALIPMLMPSPCQTRWLGGSDYAVREQTRQQVEHHQELLGAIRKLGENKIAVTALAADVLPATNVAMAKLEGPARDYETAINAWQRRVSRIRAWQYKRERKKEKAQHEAGIAKVAAEYIKTRSRWWRRVSEAEARKYAEDKCIWGGPYGSLYLSSHNDFRDDWAKSRPAKPGGYDDLPAIRELHAAASLSPNAMLSVPVDVITKVQRWAT